MEESQSESIEEFKSKSAFEEDEAEVKFPFVIDAMRGGKLQQLGEESQSESIEELKSKSKSAFEEDESGEEEVKFPSANVSSSSSSKRFKEIGRDRLSALPDCLLIHILSFLETREAASTCVLSKRWRFLWIELPSLEFINTKTYASKEETKRYASKEELEEYALMFFTVVQNALANRTANNLERFVVSSYYNKSLVSYLDALVESLMKKMVKEVTFFLTGKRYLYPLPEIVYNKSSLTCLHLQACILDYRKPIMWRSLTTLSLACIRIHEHDIGKVLSGCPVLSSFILRRCWGFDRLEIDSPSIHTLEVDDPYRGADLLVELSAPYIKSLRVIGMKMKIKDIRSVLTAEIDLGNFFPDFEFVQLRSYMTDLFAGLQHVKTLHLGHKCILHMSTIAMTGWQCPQSTRERLIVETFCSADRSISSILALLESSPSLETLDVRGYGNFDWDSAKWNSPARDDLNRNLLRLKTVNIIYFASPKLEPMLTLTRILRK